MSWYRPLQASTMGGIAWMDRSYSPGWYLLPVKASRACPRRWHSFSGATTARTWLMYPLPTSRPRSAMPLPRLSTVCGMIRCFLSATAASCKESFSWLMTAFSAGYAERQSSVPTHCCHTACVSRINSPSTTTASRQRRLSSLLRTLSTEGCERGLPTSTCAPAAKTRGMSNSPPTSAVSVDLPTEEGPRIHSAMGRGWSEVES
mmetsp:Transcript_86007/g.256566  ORF Transcript_86007/g.256566 Transcript_86007/m.256566 type:complete len:204 (-) Transcript_86007:177-788(-)